MTYKINQNYDMIVVRDSKGKVLSRHKVKIENYFITKGVS